LAQHCADHQCLAHALAWLVRLVGLAGERHLEGQLIRRCVQVAPWPRPPWPRPRRRARRRASPPSGTRQLRASGGGGGRARPPRADCSARGARAQRAGQLRLAGVEAGGLMGLVRHRLHYARRKVLPPPPPYCCPFPCPYCTLTPSLVPTGRRAWEAVGGRGRRRHRPPPRLPHPRDCAGAPRARRPAPVFVLTRRGGARRRRGATRASSASASAPRARSRATWRRCPPARVSG